ncbi:hypothetical protein [Variovorax sp. IB41]|uniref:hypothetical protein n=1 Tax=Variovorax sp. IB41 TaxID=2779370 RepID=UPI0018E778B4|nr:hypothetical protein [Variovorax sp. IB41]MBJ2157527.1 hypothetical protein [Variovorax sp. IB41]
MTIFDPHDSNGPDGRKARWPSVLGTFALHAFVALFVVLLPPIVYDAVVSSRLASIEWLQFSGGITYPLYAVYWIAKLRNPRARFMLLHLILILTLIFFAAFASNRLTPMFVAFLPVVGAAAPLLYAVASWLRGNGRLAVTCLVSSLVALLIAAPSSVLLIYSAAISPVSNMRY